jgi:outer membrane lipoprotein-sorting protein
MKNVMFLFVLLLFTGLLFGQQESELLGNLQQKFESINDFSLSFHQSSGTAGSMNGTAEYKNPGKIRISTEKLMLITDGTTSWNYNEKEDKLIISSVEDEDVAFYNLREMIFELPKECTVTEKGNRLTLVPDDPFMKGFEKVELDVTDDFLIDSIIIHDSAGNTITTSFTDYQLNKGISDSRFSFSADERTKVIDLR